MIPVILVLLASLSRQEPPAPLPALLERIRAGDAGSLAAIGDVFTHPQESLGGLEREAEGIPEPYRKILLEEWRQFRTLGPAFGKEIRVSLQGRLTAREHWENLARQSGLRLNLFHVPEGKRSFEIGLKGARPMATLVELCRRTDSWPNRTGSPQIWLHDHAGPFRSFVYRNFAFLHQKCHLVHETNFSTTNHRLVLLFTARFDGDAPLLGWKEFVEDVEAWDSDGNRLEALPQGKPLAFEEPDARLRFTGEFELPLLIGRKDPRAVSLLRFTAVGLIPVRPKVYEWKPGDPEGPFGDEDYRLRILRNDGEDTRYSFRVQVTPLRRTLLQLWNLPVAIESRHASDIGDHWETMGGVFDGQTLMYDLTLNSSRLQAGQLPEVVRISLPGEFLERRVPVEFRDLRL